MVVTLSTALVFSLVVFPALCYIMDLKDPETGSVAALVKGEWRQFLGLKSHTHGFTILPELSEDVGASPVEASAPAELVTDSDEGSSSSPDCPSQKQPDLTETSFSINQQ